MVAWEATLPQSPLINGYDRVEPDTTTRTTTQRDTLNTFYKTTLQGGSLPFTLTLPGDSTDSNLKFLSPPRYQPLRDDLWSTVLSWEVLP